MARLAVTTRVNVRRRSAAQASGYEAAVSDAASNPAIRPQPNGDVDITLPNELADALTRGEEDASPEPSVDPANIDHPEEMGGE
jgi:hypothetical protein